MILLFTQIARDSLDFFPRCESCVDSTTSVTSLTKKAVQSPHT